MGGREPAKGRRVSAALLVVGSRLGRCWSGRRPHTPCHGQQAQPAAGQPAIQRLLPVRPPSMHTCSQAALVAHACRQLQLQAGRCQREQTARCLACIGKPFGGSPQMALPDTLLQQRARGIVEERTGLGDAAGRAAEVLDASRPAASALLPPLAPAASHPDQALQGRRPPAGREGAGQEIHPRGGA